MTNSPPLPEDGKLTLQNALLAMASAPLSRAIAFELAREGCNLHLAGIDELVLETQADDLLDLFDVEIETYPTDIKESINCAALAMECDEARILVIEARGIPEGEVEDLDDEDWQGAFEANVFSSINLTREVSECMCEQGKGIILILGSIPSKNTDFCASTVNGSLEAYAKTLDQHVSRQGVRCLFFNTSGGETEDDSANAVLQLILDQLAS